MFKVRVWTVAGTTEQVFSSIEKAMMFFAKVEKVTGVLHARFFSHKKVVAEF